MNHEGEESHRHQRPRVRLESVGAGRDGRRPGRRVERFDLAIGETAVSAAVLDIVDVGIHYGQNSVWLLVDDGPTETLRFWSAFANDAIPEQYADTVGSIATHTVPVFVFVEPFWSDDDRWAAV